MATCANVLRSSGEGAAAICQANQKIKKIVLQTRRGFVCVCAQVRRGGPSIGQSRGSPPFLAGARAGKDFQSFGSLIPSAKDNFHPESNKRQLRGM